MNTNLQTYLEMTAKLLNETLTPVFWNEALAKDYAVVVLKAVKAEINSLAQAKQQWSWLKTPVNYLELLEPSTSINPLVEVLSEQIQLLNQLITHIKSLRLMGSGFVTHKYEFYIAQLTILKLGTQKYCC